MAKQIPSMMPMIGEEAVVSIPFTDMKLFRKLCYLKKQEYWKITCTISMSTAFQAVHKNKKIMFWNKIL